jgi:transcriptional regulator with XRE-family HTH domain
MNVSVVKQGRRDLPSLADQIGKPDGITVEQKIQWFVQHAIESCGSAASLARELEVSRATVSQWRSGLKKPDATNLIRIQELANQSSWPPARNDLQLMTPSSGSGEELAINRNLVTDDCEDTNG